MNEEEKLSKQKCVPCEGGTKPMKLQEIEEYLKEVHGWEYKEHTINKLFLFVDFKEAMEFVEKIAEVAEEEGHHPDIYISYNEVNIVLWTHAIGGISKNDFILAAKIDEIENK